MSGSTSERVHGVIADTGPLQYLLLIGEVELLPRLFEAVVIPAIVQTEMRHTGAPEAVRNWAGAPPPWLAVVPEAANGITGGPRRGAGERAVVMLARARGATLVLMDDRTGVTAAQAQGLSVIGTLGVLVRAAHRGMIDLDAAFTRLKGTNFRYPPVIIDALLAQHRGKGGQHE